MTKNKTSSVEAQTPAPAPHAIPELAAARDPAMAHVLHHDLESRSRVDLKIVGTARYSTDPSTEVLCLAYAVDEEPVQLWTPGDPIPQEFIEAARNPLWITNAHNDSFERTMTRNILKARFGFPEIPLERRRCSMATAYAAALPGSLEKTVDALGLPFPKDRAGKMLMLKMTKPRKPRAGEDPNGLYWYDSLEDFERLYAYCRRDVEAERALYNAVPSLIADEQKLWELDALINDRGFMTDGELLEAARRVVVETGAKLQKEFSELTGLESSGQVKKFVEWLAARDCVVTDLQRPTLGHALRRKELTPEARRAIELRLLSAHAAANKVEALLAWRGNDGRIRGSLKYHGAATGRWVGTGPQPQNFKRDAKGTDAKIAAVLAGGAGLESPVETIGDIARAMIIAAPGHRFMIGDFSGIESRVLAFDSDEVRKNERWAKFDQTGDLQDDPYYCVGLDCGLPKENARNTGKVVDLSSGFQIGWPKLQAKLKAAGVDATEQEARHYHKAWRNTHPNAVAFWDGIDKNAIAAVWQPGKLFQYKRHFLKSDGKFLRISLPSGRTLFYPFPRIGTGKFGNPCVIFKNSQQGKWVDCKFGDGFYGGAWTENIISGMARDLLAGAMMRLDAAGYRIVLTVHDEVVAEVPDGFGSLKEFHAILTAKPEWAAGNLPIAAKVRESARFSKPDSGAVLPKVSGSDSTAAAAAEIEDDSSVAFIAAYDYYKKALEQMRKGDAVP